MPRKTVTVSSVSGEEIPEGQGGVAKITHDGKTYVADLTDEEATKAIADLSAEAPQPRTRTRRPAAA